MADNTPFSPFLWTPWFCRCSKPLKSKDSEKWLRIMYAIIC